MRLLLDASPLRESPDFRRLFVGQSVSFVGSQMTTAALLFQVFAKTHSSLAVGLVGLAQLGPLVIFSVVGGAYADGHDKRRLLLALTGGAILCSVALAFNAAATPPALWPLYSFGAASSAVNALFTPAFRSLATLVLPAELRPAGFALQAGYGSFAMMAGPAVAGLVIATLGFVGVYWIDVATYLLAAVSFFKLSSAPPVLDAARTSLRSFVEGMRFLRGSVTASVFVIDAIAMVCGMPVALLPALAHRLGGGAVLYGLMSGAAPAGAFLASVSSGWVGRVRRQGRVLLLAVGAWGVAITALGLSRSLDVVFLALVGAGAADMISGVYRYAITADATPDHLRGRISGAEQAVYAGGPAVGNLEAGVAGGIFGVPVAIVSGGVACIVAAVLFAWRVPRLRTYESRSTASPLAAPEIIDQ